MSGIVDALYEIKYSPFEYNEYIASFYLEAIDVENNILLAPLVIPLCSHPIFGTKLFNSNVKSSIWTLFSDRTKLFDLQERIDEFKDLTNKSIQSCLSNDWISIDKDKLSLKADDNSTFTRQKSAQKLGRLIKGQSVVEVYAFLGVKPR